MTDSVMNDGRIPFRTFLDWANSRWTRKVLRSFGTERGENALREAWNAGHRRGVEEGKRYGLMLKRQAVTHRVVALVRNGQLSKEDHDRFMEIMFPKGGTEW